MQLDPIKGDFFETLGISPEHKIYTSNVGYIVIPKDGSSVYKAFLKQEIFEKEMKIYEIFEKEGILVPHYEGIGKISDYYVLKLENIRKDYKRKNEIVDLDLHQVAEILRKIHTINSVAYFGGNAQGKYFIIGDVHSSNFFEKKISEGKVQLGIFDFSSAKFGEKEEDLANLYIDIYLNDQVMNEFLSWYGLDVEVLKIYKYAFMELQERIKNGMNLKAEKKKRYYTFMLILRDKLKTYGT